MKTSSNEVCFDLLALDCAVKDDVDAEKQWRHMNSCPVATRVELFGAGGIAHMGAWNGKDSFWLAWHPLPTEPAWLLELKCPSKLA
jgi:hypothetical protein